MDRAAQQVRIERYKRMCKDLGERCTAPRLMILQALDPFTNPVEHGLASQDPKMIALEAYATCERRGVPLEPGKH